MANYITDSIEISSGSYREKIMIRETLMKKSLIKKIRKKKVWMKKILMKKILMKKIKKYFLIFFSIHKNDK